MSKGSSRHFYVLENGQWSPDHGLGIRDARKKKAFPSPTTVLADVFAKPFHLNRWLRQQLVSACVESPMYANETMEEYYNRVDRLSNSKSEKATAFGTAIHNAVEQPRGAFVQPELIPYVDYFWQWYDENVERDLAIEEIVADTRIGIAGRNDRRVIMRDGTMAVLDVKTQGIKDKHYVSDSWSPQGGLYVEGIQHMLSLTERPRFINIIINSNEPQPVIPHEWSSAEIDDGYKLMTVASWCFSHKNNHWPVGKWDLLKQ